MPDELVILGAGGFARELFWFARDANPQLRLAFADDQSGIEALTLGAERVPVVQGWRFEGRPPFVVGVADPAAKRALVARALEAGLAPAPTLVHPRSTVRPDCELGRGGILARDSLLTAHVTLGDYVLVLDTSVGHDDVIGDYTTCLPGCRVSGGVVLGEDVVLGAGTVVRDGVRIARGVRTGAMACVVKDVSEPDVTLVGIPARPIHGAS